MTVKPTLLPRWGSPWRCPTRGGGWGWGTAWGWWRGRSAPPSPPRGPSWRGPRVTRAALVTVNRNISIYRWSVRPCLCSHCCTFIKLERRLFDTQTTNKVDILSTLGFIENETLVFVD